MMSLAINKKIKQAVLVSTLMCILPVAQAWVTPVNVDADHTGNDEKNTVTSALGDFDRCDTSANGYDELDDPAPTQCHRRNLVWQLGSKNNSGIAETLAQWNPDLGGDANWRLPTIKELSRLVDYSDISAAGGALTGQSLILNMFVGAVGFSVESSWLISSTYRDIDGNPNNGNAQIFGINMGTGETAAFDTVVADAPVPAEESVSEVAVFDAEENQSWSVASEYSRVVTYAGDDKVVVTEEVTLSEDNGDGTFTISGQVHTNYYPLSLVKCDSLNASGACATTSAANVYALLVHTQTVSGPP